MPRPQENTDLARYLVIHTPRTDIDDETVFPPTSLAAMAQDALSDTATVRWLSTFSPDLNDERHVSLWEAETADDVRAALEHYGYFTEMDAHPIRVHEWKPADVLTAADER